MIGHFVPASLKRDLLADVLASDKRRRRQRCNERCYGRNRRRFPPQPRRSHRQIAERWASAPARKAPHPATHSRYRHRSARSDTRTVTAKPSMEIAVTTVSIQERAPLKAGPSLGRKRPKERDDDYVVADGVRGSATNCLNVCSQGARSWRSRPRLELFDEAHRQELAGTTLPAAPPIRLTGRSRAGRPSARRP
jgi:hypothetical protein